MNNTRLLRFFKNQFSENEVEKNFNVRPWMTVTLILIELAPIIVWEIWIQMNQSGAGINMAFLFLFLIQVIIFYYIPATLIYGIVRVLDTGNIEATIRHPFLGFGNLSVKSAFIVWTIQMIFVGVFLSSISNGIHNGISPIIPF